MKSSLIPRLRCSVSGQPLHAQGAPLAASAAELEKGWLVSEDGKHRYPVRDGIPRFVPASNYPDNFGMQWNKFSRTQLDSHSGHPITPERFWAATGWKPADMKDRWLLDVGCGSGRFAGVAPGAGANEVALDYSSAVDAAAANLRQRERLHVVQGDIYALPFAPALFDAVYSLGVLQHTPDVERAFMALPRMFRPDGAMVVDFYGKSWKCALLPKCWLRPLTKRLPKATLFGLLERLVPVANNTGMLPLSQHIREWALLDTFDWLSPAYDHPQTPQTVGPWLQAAGLQQTEVLHAGHLVGRGRRP